MLIIEKVLIVSVLIMEKVLIVSVLIMSGHRIQKFFWNSRDFRHSVNDSLKWYPDYFRSKGRRWVKNSRKNPPNPWMRSLVCLQRWKNLNLKCNLHLVRIKRWVAFEKWLKFSERENMKYRKENTVSPRQSDFTRNINDLFRRYT